MKIIRRELLHLAWVAIALPSMSKIAWAQTQVTPKLAQILRKDLEGQGQVVQETIVSVIDFGPGTAAPWHMHPGAQELLHVIEGNLVVEVEGAGTTLLKTGEAGIIAANLVHLARNENTRGSAKALVVHSRAAKDGRVEVQMKIAVAKEIDRSEPRVAASPDAVKKFKALGVDMAVEPGAGIKSGLPDSEFTAAGATVSTDALDNADIVIKVKRPEASELANYKRGALVIAIMDLCVPKTISEFGQN